MRIPKTAEYPGLVVDTVIEDPRWNEIGLATIGGAACAVALRGARVTTCGREIDILGCDDRRITDLNHRFRNVEAPTNVLAWPNNPDPARPDKGGSLGSIAVAFETCMREAQEQGKAPEDHVTHLIVHGCLHLVGFAHDEDDDAAKMEAIEAKALAHFGIANPYLSRERTDSSLSVGPLRK